jgi:FtsZ-binding cell division protein ZapB
MATMQQQPEVDTLSNLEERIQRAVALVNRLRQERETALKDLDETRSNLQKSEDEGATLRSELEAMREERRQVRERIERLLGHIDQLGAA